MKLQFLVDMNLSVEWIPRLRSHGYDAIHWSHIGDPRASDLEILDWARSRSFVVFTHDLDFTTALALTRAVGPSVLQVRSSHVMPDDLEGILIPAIQQCESELLSGALVTVDPSRFRLRVLPI